MRSSCQVQGCTACRRIRLVHPTRRRAARNRIYIYIRKVVRVRGARVQNRIYNEDNLQVVE